MAPRFSLSRQYKVTTMDDLIFQDSYRSQKDPCLIDERILPFLAEIGYMAMVLLALVVS